MDRNIDFEILGIAAALQRHRLYVPPNQREYSWTEDEVLDLLQDLANAMRSDSDYFLGTIVLTKGADGKLQVADGQQRLATTTMVLAAIRDRFVDLEDDVVVQALENDFLFNIDARAREKLARLTLNSDDNEYFRNVILNRQKDRGSVRQSRRSHRLISGAVNLIREHFRNLESQLGSANFPNALLDWRDYLEKKAHVLVVEVAKATNAFKMFETLNARGLKTSQADLVKNYLFEKSDDRLAEAQVQWSAMRGAVETIGEDDFTMEYLRLACCVMTGPTREKDVMERVETNARSKSEAMRLLHLLAEMSTDYAAILNPDHPKWNGYDESVRKSIMAINKLGVTQIRPLMLSVARHFTAGQTETAFRRMVSWSVRFLIVGGRGGKLDEGYAKLANEIYAGTIKSWTDLYNATTTFIPSDAQFRAAFEVAKVSVSRLARYYLRSLETTARTQADPEFVPNEDLVITLEHIMPQNPGKGWDNITPQDVETHGTRLGNLALLQATKNVDADRENFEFKRALYKDSSFLLTNQLAQVGTWGTKDIEERQKTLAGIAVSTWPLT